MPHPKASLPTVSILASGAVLFLGMTVANGGAYVLNLVVGRLLGPTDFGVFVSLVSLAAILTMPATALATVATKFSAEFVAQREFGKLRTLAQLLERTAVWAGLGLLVGLGVAAPNVQQYLQLPARLPIVVLAISFGLSFLLPVARGFLQGQQRFAALSLNTALEPLIKLVAVVGLIRFGFGVSGAVASYGIAFASCYLLARWMMLPASASTASTSPIDRRTIWTYSLPTLVTLVSLSFLTSADVILAKHYFSADDAGIYAGLATIGKIILYVSAPLVAVMFPLIATKVSQGERHVTLLAQTLLLMVAGSAGVLALFTIAPKFSVTVLFGVRYLGAAPYLASYGVAMLMLALVTVLTHYFLSIGQTRVSWLVFVGLIVEVGAVAQLHANIGQVIMALIISFGLVLALLVGFYVWLKRSQLAAFMKIKAA